MFLLGEEPGMRDVFLEEYSTADAVRKYTRRTAGSGIEYLLDHDYADIYLDVITNYVLDTAKCTDCGSWSSAAAGG
jgi:hypothetical protein